MAVESGYVLGAPALGLVSVIVPCYNQGRYLADALNSVLAQTHPHWECIVVNDGSTDETRRVALGYASTDPRFRYVEQQNSGLSAARNRGLREIRGQYVQFLDSDDAISADKLRLQLEAAAGVERLHLVYCDHYYAAEEDLTEVLHYEPYPSPRFVMEKPLWDIASRWETELSIPVHSFLFDARVFTDHGITFDPSLPSHEDWDCWMRIFALGIQVIHVERTLAAYRFHDAAMCRDEERMFKGFAAALEKHRLIWRGDPDMSRLLNRKMRQTRVIYGKSPMYNVLAAISGNKAFKRLFPWPGQKVVHRVMDHIK
jgi:glycosyltransferase involved in cell wall biosynthesis